MFGMDGIADAIRLAEKFMPAAERIVTVAEQAYNDSDLKAQLEQDGKTSLVFTISGTHKFTVLIEDLRKTAINAEIEVSPEV